MIMVENKIADPLGNGCRVAFPGRIHALVKKQRLLDKNAGWPGTPFPKFVWGLVLKVKNDLPPPASILGPTVFMKPANSLLWK